MNKRYIFTIGMLFVLAGSLLAYQPLTDYWRLHHQGPAAQAPARTPQLLAETKVNDVIKGKPVRIVIPAVNIDVQIEDGIYYPRSKTWSLSLTKAEYALMTPEPNNQGGNTFIYGHNRKEVFNRLPGLPIGQEVTVYTDNNHVFTYKYRSHYETNPNDSGFLTNQQGPPTLTLQTCTGIWYQNRNLMTFDLVKVS